jgi:hypothetical protein
MQDQHIDTRRKLHKARIQSCLIPAEHDAEELALDATRARVLRRAEQKVRSPQYHRARAPSAASGRTLKVRDTERLSFGAALDAVI